MEITDQSSVASAVLLAVTTATRMNEWMKRSYESVHFMSRIVYAQNSATIAQTLEVYRLSDLYLYRYCLYVVSLVLVNFVCI